MSGTVRGGWAHLVTVGLGEQGDLHGEADTHGIRQDPGPLGHPSAGGGLQGRVGGYRVPLPVPLPSHSQCARGKPGQTVTSVGCVV